MGGNTREHLDALRVLVVIHRVGNMALAPQHSQLVPQKLVSK